MLGNTLVTIQTGEHGKQVNRLYVTDGADIAKEFYLALLVDRVSGPHRASSSRPRAAWTSRTVAHDTLEKIHTFDVDPATGFICRTTAAPSPARWASTAIRARQAASTASKLYRDDASARVPQRCDVIDIDAKAQGANRHHGRVGESTARRIVATGCATDCWELA